LTNIKQVYNVCKSPAELKNQRCNICLHVWRSTNMFTNIEANVNLLLFRIYFGLILNLWSCLTFFQLFWSWTPYITNCEANVSLLLFCPYKTNVYRMSLVWDSWGNHNCEDIFCCFSDVLRKKNNFTQFLQMLVDLLK
jgi:hypothetical protein